MIIFDIYVDLLKKIDLVKTVLAAYLNADEEVLNNSTEQELIDRIEEIKILENTLQGYKEFEEKLKEDIYSLEGLHYKIARLQIIENKNYIEIAEDLNHSYGYIRKAVSESKKEDVPLLS